jgi:hypothetical protein
MTAEYEYFDEAIDYMAANDTMVALRVSLGELGDRYDTPRPVVHLYAKQYDQDWPHLELLETRTPSIDLAYGRHDDRHLFYSKGCQTLAFDGDHTLLVAVPWVHCVFVWDVAYDTYPIVHSDSVFCYKDNVEGTPSSSSPRWRKFDFAMTARNGTVAIITGESVCLYHAKLGHYARGIQVPRFPNSMLVNIRACAFNFAGTELAMLWAGDMRKITMDVYRVPDFELQTEVYGLGDQLCTLSDVGVCATDSNCWLVLRAGEHSFVSLFEVGTDGQFSGPDEFQFRPCGGLYVESGTSDAQFFLTAEEEAAAISEEASESESESEVNGMCVQVVPSWGLLVLTTRSRGDWPKSCLGILQAPVAMSSTRTAWLSAVCRCGNRTRNP